MVLLALGCALLIAVVLRARVLAARRAGVALEQRSWSPAVAFALAAEHSVPRGRPCPWRARRRRHPSSTGPAPLLTGVLALALLVLGVWLEVPVTRALGVAALVMAASLLTPVAPLDGGDVAESPAGTAATLALLGTGLLILIGLA